MLQLFICYRHPNLFCQWYFPRWNGSISKNPNSLKSEWVWTWSQRGITHRSCVLELWSFPSQWNNIAFMRVPWHCKETVGMPRVLRHHRTVTAASAGVWGWVMSQARLANLWMCVYKAGRMCCCLITHVRMCKRNSGCDGGHNRGRMWSTWTSGTRPFLQFLYLCPEMQKYLNGTEYVCVNIHYTNILGNTTDQSMACCIWTTNNNTNLHYTQTLTTDAHIKTHKTHMWPSACTSYHLSDAGFPPWHRFGVMKRVGKVQNPNSFGWDLFSFPLITMQLLTDSKHGPTQSQCFHSVSGRADRQTDGVRKERKKVRRKEKRQKWTGPQRCLTKRSSIPN